MRSVSISTFVSAAFLVAAAVPARADTPAAPEKVKCMPYETIANPTAWTAADGTKVVISLDVEKCSNHYVTVARTTQVGDGKATTSPPSRIPDLGEPWAAVRSVGTEHVYVIVGHTDPKGVEMVNVEAMHVDAKTHKLVSDGRVITSLSAGVPTAKKPPTWLAGLDLSPPEASPAAR